MPIEWYKPGKRTPSLEPSIKISQQLISLNQASINKWFQGKEYVRIGYEKDTKKLFFVPVGKEDADGMKIITNNNSTSKYINAKGVFYKYGLADANKKVIPDLIGKYECDWDKENQAVYIILK